MGAVDSDRTGNGVKVRVVSFAYRRGIPADTWGNGGGFVFDCRGLPNPFWVEGLRNHSGAEPEVRAFFDGHREAVEAFARAAEALVLQTVRAYQADGRSRLMVAFGCTGGKHRSVFMAERMAERLRGEGVEVEIAHTEEGRWWKP